MRQNGKWGYIDRRGRVVIQPQFAWSVWVFSEGLAEAWPEGKSRCGFIDKTGSFIIAPLLPRRKCKQQCMSERPAPRHLTD